ncbi:MAG: hypothetical protein UY31_C0004G0012 [Candidatus Wolfebacteria bacterium GW2011_GWE1_48_7]|nr:MAG: hypothetical protein UX58_C0007G0008 [Candidatus Wolfebacteria bacterium GW2011_GWB2_46_69]KKU53518.1 MAG: hypothetical protein UX76_C0014G0014 [Candidatus Wolfebacteria bacterium GW2011_GWC1_47_103]KKU65849.1 MAG: hypothetical protein UX90_C0002G0225 [Candidatus Wolfebacteria bacterium GW2011_GWD2_47_17]KKU70839.1 MAG: hypothetical protein UX96_C0035G0010 [Candidatus Wolfebacteria bacterium GW2011_GWB1_47_243]KKU88400.1 MAG: hypothetical protein UY19_C0030G0007 [Candidatus Wolfebacteri
MTIAAVMFAAGFLIEVIRKPAALDYEIMEFFHHISLITGAVVLVYASIVMPKEAVKISEVVNTLQ